MNVLETERLALRHLDMDDAAFMLTLLNDPAFLANIGDRGVRTVEEAAAYIARGPSASYEQHGFGLYAVTPRPTGDPVGICGLVKRDGLDDVDIGFAFLPAARGLGYATESAAAVKAWALGTIGLTRLVAIVQTDNRGSVRVLDKLGFRHERMVRLTVDADALMLFAFDAAGAATGTMAG